MSFLKSCNNTVVLNFSLQIALISTPTNGYSSILIAQLYGMSELSIVLPHSISFFKIISLILFKTFWNWQMPYTNCLIKYIANKRIVKTKTFHYFIYALVVFILSGSRMQAILLMGTMLMPLSWNMTMKELYPILE